MSERMLAATTIGAFRTEIREYPSPETPPDAGIRKIEAAGACGSDWQEYQQDRPPRFMGHENVGRIYRIGPAASRRWGLREGDRVALEEYLPCGHCIFAAVANSGCARKLKRAAPGRCDTAQRR